jgi:hypothetical protein
MRVALMVLLGGIVALAALVTLMVGWVRRLWLVVAGSIVALAALVVLFPVNCESTLIEMPPGGPDPNGAFCSTAVFARLDSVQGGHPSTHEEFTTADLVRQRMAIRALAASAVPLLLGMAGGRLLARRDSHLERDNVADPHRPTSTP